MLVSQSNLQTQRSRGNKENLTPYEALKSIVSRNEQALIQIRRQLKQKVNRSDFLSSISSKVSLSDITTLTNISEIQQQEVPLRLMVKEEVEREVSMALQIIQNENKAEISSLKKIVQELTQKLQYLQKQIICDQSKIRQLRQSQQSLALRVQQKAQRSQLDKMMHLSSLLAIQFQLIKKRFGTFELDYNLVWKEISALYSQQDSLRSVFETQRKDSMENTREKQLQVLLRTCKNKDIVAKLFGEKERDREEVEPFSIDDEDCDLRKKLEGVQNIQRDQQFSLKNFSERLMTIEKDFENQSQFFKQIKQLKKDYNESREEVLFLEQKCRNLKKETQQMVQQQCKVGVNKLESSIGQEIRQACEEITTKMMNLFEQCVKHTENAALKRDIDEIQQKNIERIDEINDNFKKNANNVNIRFNLHQDKLRIMEKDLTKRLKIEQFEQIRQNLITYDASQTIIKKAQSQLKKQISQFRQSQKTINEVICSQNILARWVWVSGQLKCGNLINWDRQVVNTLPNNFVFLPTQGVVRIVSSGIYRVQMAFYAKKKPSIQIIINGKTIVSAVNSSSYVVHHSSGKLKDISNSEVSGLAYYDFFSLQQNSRMAISYSGEQGHGFFGIQRL